MPATAGRVRMPANNRVHSSAALQTHGIWQSAIGYDPYAPNKEDSKKSAAQQPHQSSTAEPEGENAYASFQGLLALARITGSNADEARGSCKKCGRVGHLTFQCRNFLSIKEDKEKDPEAIQAAVMSGLEKLKGGGKRRESSDDESEEDESESSDSDYDSEMERAIAQKYGKRAGGSGKSKSLRKKKDDDDDSEERRRKRGRSKKKSGKRSVSDSDEDDVSGKKKRKKEKRRRRDDDDVASDEDRERRKSRREKRRRRSHRHDSDEDDDSDSSEEDSRRRRRHHNKRKSKKKSKRSAAVSTSDSDASSFEDSRVGRDKKRSERRNRRK